jgi:DNA-binding NtrC family response regulator
MMGHAMMLNSESEPGNLDAGTAPERRLTIVWIDDDVDLTMQMAPFLQKAFPDAEILMFADGNAAWEWLDENSPDLLISDLVHPGLSGIDMLSRLCRKDVAYPIVLVSGMMTKLEPDARRNAGPRLKVHYLPKPYFMNQFIFLLKQCLARPLLVAGLRQWSAGLARPLKIVHLDDEDPILNLVAVLLRHCLRQVLLYQFQHSPDAWRILSEAKPDLLITDDIMHGNRDWNGESIVRCLVERRVGYPILVTSAWSETQEWVRQLEAECDNVSFLSAPYAPVEFYRELSRALGPLLP